MGSESKSMRHTLLYKTQHLSATLGVVALVVTLQQHQEEGEQRQVFVKLVRRAGRVRKNSSTYALHNVAKFSTAWRRATQICSRQAVTRQQSSSAAARTGNTPRRMLVCQSVTAVQPQGHRHSPQLAALSRAGARSSGWCPCTPPAPSRPPPCCQTARMAGGMARQKKQSVEELDHACAMVWQKFRCTAARQGRCSGGRDCW
jgi:hypothetical protein